MRLPTRSLPLFTRLLRVLVVASLAAHAACSTEIGDECTSDSECGEGRVCDRASHAGYCTISPCGPNSCPENSVCVRFENDLTYCMFYCEANDDCREGYTCTEDPVAAPAPFCRQSEKH